jgi:hypothetical protein
MRTEDLVASLVRDARPVRRMPRPALLVPALVGVSALVALAWSAALGLRPDLEPRLLEVRFWLVTGLLIAVCAAGESVLATLSIPGRRRFPLGAKAGLALFVALTGALLAGTPWFEISPWTRWFGVGLYCTARVVLVGLVPILAGLWLLRRAAPVFPGLSGALLGLVAAWLGAFALQWSCDLSEPAHVVIWHMAMPGALLAAAGAWAGSRRLRW